MISKYSIQKNYTANNPERDFLFDLVFLIIYTGSKKKHNFQFKLWII